MESMKRITYVWNKTPVYNIRVIKNYKINSLWTENGAAISEVRIVYLMFIHLLKTSCISKVHYCSYIIIIIIYIIRAQKQRFPSNSLYPRCTLSNLIQLNVFKCVFNLKYLNYNCFRLLT